MNAAKRHNLKISGTGERTMLFAHGFGCDLSMWRHVAPQFEDGFQVALFDYVGAGGSLCTYNPDKYCKLDGYAEDVIEIGDVVGIRGGIFVGHSVSAMIGALASIQRPEMFSTLVMVGPSPRYIDDDDYVGGFSHKDIDELLNALNDNPLAWSASMAPAIVGNPDRPEYGEELAESFCKLDPEIANGFARATFTSDNRRDLPKISAQTLILQCREDIIASEQVGKYVHNSIPQSTLVMLDASGHCPNLTAPDQVTTAIRDFV